MKTRVCLVIAAVLLLVAPIAQAQLVITEVVEGNGANFKYVEIRNAGATAFDLTTAGAQLRRYTNGGTTATNINLTGTIAAGAFFVIANNATDFNAVWPLPAAANQYDSNVNHNGDDSYQLWDGTSVVDAFAYDWVTGTDPGNPAADGAFHRVGSAYPNNGNWGGTVAVGDGVASASGFWIRAALTSANANAATVCTPGAAGGSSGSELPVELLGVEID